MITLQSFRQQYPEQTKEMSDEDIIYGASKQFNLSLEDAAKSFGVDPTQRTWTEAVADTGIKGVNALMGGLGALGAAFDPSGGADLKHLQSLGNNALSLKSKVGNDNLGRALSTSDVGTQLGGVWDYLKNDPLGAATEAAFQLAIPAGAVKGTQFLAKGLGKLATEKVVKNAGTGAAMATSAALAGGDAAGDAYERVFAATGDEEKAMTAARQAQKLPSAVGALAGLVGVDKLMARGGGLAGGSARVLGTAAAEGGSEFVEEGLTKLEANRAVAPYVPGTDILAGVVGSGALGAAQGMVMGGGAAFGHNILQGPERAVQGAINNSNAGTSTGTGSGVGTTSNGTLSIQEMARQEGELQAQARAAEKAQKAAAGNTANTANTANATTGVSPGVSSGAQQGQALAQANQQANQQAQAAQQQQASAQLPQQLFDQFGMRPVMDPATNAPNGRFTFGDKTFFTENDATTFAKQMIEAGKDLTPLQQSLAGKLFAGNVIPVKAPDKAQAAINRANKFMQDNQLASAQTMEEVVQRIDSIIEAVAPKTDMIGEKVSTDAQMIRNLDKLYETITGKPSDRLGEIADQQLMELKQEEQAKADAAEKKKSASANKTAKTPAKKTEESKSGPVVSIPVEQYQNQTGATNGQQQQSSPGVGDVSGNTGAGSTVPPANVGNGPTNVQSKQSGSVPQGQNGQQNDVTGGTGDGQRAVQSSTDVPTGGSSTQEAKQEVKSSSKNKEDSNGGKTDSQETTKDVGLDTGTGAGEGKDSGTNDANSGRVGGRRKGPSQAELDQRRKENRAITAAQDAAAQERAAKDVTVAKQAFRKILEYVFIEHGGNRGKETADKRVDFFEALFGIPVEQREESTPETAEKLGVKISTAKGWAKDLVIDEETGLERFVTKYQARMKKAMTAVAADFDLSPEQMKEIVVANFAAEKLVNDLSEIEQETNTYVDDRGQTNVSDEDVGADKELSQENYADEISNDGESGDARSGSIINSPGATSTSEQNNKAEGISKRWEKISKKVEDITAAIDDARLEGADTATIEKLEAELKKAEDKQAELFADVEKEQRKANNKNIRPAATDTTTTKVEPKKAAPKKADAPIQTSAEKYAELTKGFEGVPKFEDLTDNEQNRIKDLAQRDQLNLAAIQKVIGDKQVQPSKSPKIANSYKAKELRDEVIDYIGVDNASKLVVFQSGKEVPAHILRVAPDAGKNQGFVYGGRAYLIADNIEQGRGKAVFLHEVGSHLGLQEMLDTEFNDMVDQINAWASDNNDSQESRIAQKARARVKAAGTSAEQYEAELVAYFIEEAVLDGVEPSQRGAVAKILDKVIKAFSKALKLLQINPQFLSAQDIVDMAYGAARIELSSALDTNPPAANNVQMSVASAVTPNQNRKIERNLQRVPPKARPYFNAFAKATARAMNHLKFTSHILDKAAKTMPSAGKYLALVREQQAMMNNELHKVEKISQAYQQLPKSTQTEVNGLISDSTKSRKWAFVPSWLSGLEKQPKVDAALEERFNALSEDAQEVVRDVFAHGYVTLARLKNAAREQTNALYDDEIAKAKKDGDAAQVTELESEKASQLKEFQKLFETNSTSPYAPLRRFGKHVVTYRSERMQNSMDIIEAARDGEIIDEADLKAVKDFVRKNEGDPEHYQVHFRESAVEAEQLGESLRSQYDNAGQVQQFTRDDAAQQLYTSNDLHGLMYRLRKKADDLADNGTQSDAAARQLSRIMAELHVSLMSEQSARHAENRRAEGTVTGSDANMMRAFHTHGLATASLMASLHKSKNVQQALEGFEKEAKDRRNPDRETAESTYNEIAARHSIGLSTNDSQITNKALRYNSAFMLLSRPIYYLQNSLQPWMVTLPVLSGRYGARASGELFKAYQDVSGILTTNQFNVDVINKLPEDVRQLVTDLLDSGRLNISLDQEMGDRLKGTNVLDRTITKLQGVAERVEAINRVTTAIASYRLATTDKKSPKSHNEAVKYAGDIIYDTHGDYSGFNAPRIMRSQVGRVATQFRKFQMIQIGLLAKLGREAFLNKDATPEERTVARMALTYTLGTTFAMGGMTALPGFAAIAWIVGKIFGSADEPNDPEAQLARIRRMIGDPDLADLLTEGLPKLGGFDGEAIFGGMGNMLSAIPYTKVENADRSTYQNILMGLSGPLVGGLGPKIFSGMGDFADGNISKGLSQVLPTGIGNVVKAMEMADKGLTRARGTQILSPDDVSAFSVTMQALGLRSNEVSDTQFINRVTTTYDAYYRDESRKVKEQYASAFKNGDAQALKQARERWAELNESRRKNGFPVQPLSGLIKSPNQARKYEQRVKNQLNTTGQSLAAMR